MAARRGDGSGWLQTLLGAAVLLVVGFGVGLVGGEALEEPGLLFRAATDAAGRARSDAERDGPDGGWASGETDAPARERTVARPAVPVRDPEPASGAWQEGGGGAPPAPEPPAPSPPRAAPPPPRAVAARPPSPPAATSGWAVQLGAFADEAAARAFVARLRDQGVEAHVAHGSAGEPAPFRVRVGPFATRERADAEARRLQEGHSLSTWVLSVGRT